MIIFGRQLLGCNYAATWEYGLLVYMSTERGASELGRFLAKAA